MRAVLFVVLAMPWFVGCGAGRIGSKGVADAGAGGGGDLSSVKTCNGVETCGTSGATRCMGPLVETCVDDGGGCLVWGAPMACPMGQTCAPDPMNANGGSCVDACTTPALMNACATAVEVANACCGGVSTDAVSLCQTFAGAGKDPMQQCAAWTLQTDCGTVHDTFQALDGCCCQPGFVCDPLHNNACVTPCTSRASCDGNPNGSDCALIGMNGVITEKGMVCRPDDGKPLDACQFLANNGCDNGYDCWKDAQGNAICTKSCTVDNDCGNPGVACCNHAAKCNKIFGACGGTGACLPCP